jgi:hypothetical protein
MKRQGPGLPAVQTDFFVPAGGLDEITPPLMTKDGACRRMQNYEQDIRGGYRRIEGYERFAGQPVISRMTFHTMSIGCASESGYSIPTLGTLRGATSGATALFVAPTSTSESVLESAFRPAFGVAVTGTSCFVANLSGQFEPSEEILVSDRADLPVPFVARTTAVPVVGENALDNAQRVYQVERLVAALVYGVALRNEYIYCKVLSVAEFNGMPVVAAVVQEISASVKSLKFFLPIYSSDQVAAWSPYWVGVGSALAIGGANLASEPEYCDIISYNFSGATGDRRLWCVTGVGKAFSLSAPGAVNFVTTGMAVDKPTRIAVHGNRLFLAFGPSMQFSAAGDPFSWTPVLGAGEINMGEPITSMRTVKGSDSTEVLLAGTQKGLAILYGNSASTFQLSWVSREVGMQAGSLQIMSNPIFVNDYGVTSLAAAQEFGNFNDAIISQSVQRFIEKRVRRVSCSVLVRSKNQYRVFFNDGTALYFTFSGSKLAAITPMRFPRPVRSIVSYYNGDEEVILFTTDTTFVYRMDVGRNFDGEAIDAFALMSFNHLKSPRLRKAFRRLVLEVIADSGYVAFKAGADVDYSGPVAQQSPEQDVQANNETLWDEFTWDEFTWDTSGRGPITVPVDGTGKNVALFVRCADKYVDPHTISGVMTDWVARRSER